jgi:hypothetical protein
MGLKSIAHIGEWEVRINPGMMSMCNLRIPGKPLKGEHWETRDGIIGCFDFFAISEDFRGNRCLLNVRDTKGFGI